MRLEGLYRDALARVRGALPDGPVIVVEEPGGLLTDTLARDLPAPVLGLDARIAGDDAGLGADLARGVAAFATGLEQTLDSVARLDAGARSALGRVAGRRSEAVLAAATGGDGAASLDELLRAVPDGSAVLLAHAHLLDASLWTLRAHADRLRVVLTCRAWHVDGLTGPQSAFLGYGTVVASGPPSRTDWAHAGLAFAYLRQADDLQNVALGVELIELGDGDPERGWEAAVAARAAQLDAILGGALAAHALGPRLLLTLAQGRAPYGIVPAAAPNRVALALRRLRDAELIHQPAPRRWALVDAALGRALRARPGAGAVLGAGPPRRRKRADRSE